LNHLTGTHKCRFDIVCVWKFDRFARSVSHLLRALEEFRALGIELASYGENIDTTPSRRRAETILIAERVRSGLRNARAKGKRLGRPVARVSDADIRQLLSSGLSMQATAEKLNVSVATICRRARNV
jgi:DNA invertase Pin-like site-specific DNA recombinase